MPAHHCNDAQSFGQKPTQVIEKPNTLPLADSVYQFGSEYVIILGGEECAWSDDHTQAARSFAEMLEAELSEVLL